MQKTRRDRENLDRGPDPLGEATEVGCVDRVPFVYDRREFGDVAMHLLAARLPRLAVKRSMALMPLCLRMSAR